MILSILIWAIITIVLIGVALIESMVWILVGIFVVVVALAAVYDIITWPYRYIKKRKEK